MKLPVKILLEDVLASCSPAAEPGCLNRMVDLSCLELFSGTFCAERLYILRASELPQALPEEQLPVCLLCVEDGDIPAFFIGNGNVLLIRLAADARPNQVYSLIAGYCDGIHAQIFPSSTLRELMGAASRCDLLSLTENIGQMFGKGVFILGRDAKVLSYSENCEFCSKVSRQLIQTGEHPDYARLQKLHTGGIYHLEGGQMSPVSHGSFIPDELVVPVLHAVNGKEVVAYLIVCCDGGYVARDMVTMLLFARDVISGMFSRYAITDSASSVLISSMLEGVLTGGIADNDAINAYLKRTRFRSRKYYAMIAVAPRDLDVGSQGVNAFLASNACADIWESAYATCIDGRTIILVSGNDMELLDSRRLGLLNQCLAASDCVAGISDVFHELNIYLRHHSTRANAAMEMSSVFFNEKKRYHQYKEILLYYFIKYGYSSGSHYLVDPRVLMLKEYDQKNGTDFLDTLRCFWLCDKNTDKSCEMMHIHRNTLFYRLRKIREISLLDLSASATFLDLNLSFAIAVRQGLLQYIDPPSEGLGYSGGAEESRYDRAMLIDAD